LRYFYFSTFVTEVYSTNVQLCEKKIVLLGIHHEIFDVDEVFLVFKKGVYYSMQQVGRAND